VLVDIQFNPTMRDWARLRDDVLRAEQDGYSTTWVFDHLRADTLRGEQPVMECCTLLGALAACTTTIGLGSMVANVANRHPAILAIAAATVQRISGGRFIAGIGAGAAPGTRWAHEHEVLGIPLAASIDDRHQRVVEQIAALRAETDAPIIVGVNTRRLARLAGQLADGVNVRLSHERAAEFLAAATEAAHGRRFERSAWTDEDTTERRDQAEALEIDRLIIAPPT